ncbi:MAG: hypothetical protein AB7F28_04280 [Candidatus Margulisiibacteriota bacterium]
MILFYTTGSQETGLGHLSRTLALMDTLKENNMACHCLVNPDPVVLGALRDRNVLHTPMFDFEGFKSFIDATQPQVLIIDTKAPLSDELRYAKSLGIKLVLIDCLNESRFLADLVIYPNAHFDFKALDWTGFDGEVLGGAPYTIIHPKFIEARNKLAHHNYRSRLMVSMGATDPNNLTLKLVPWLYDLGIKVDVIIGPGFQNVRALKKTKETGIIFHENCSDLSQYLRLASLFITTLGTSIYEAAVMKVPVVVISNFKSDEPDEKRLAKLPGITTLGYHENLTETQFRLAIKSELLTVGSQEESKAIGNLIDGQGTSRIVERIAALC